MAKPFTVTRSTTINAAPAEIHTLVNNFHHWLAWSPWEGLDPHLERTYAGPDAGNGASYAWTGNKAAGAGTMKITGSTPDQIDIDLAFTKPFKSEQKVTFTLAEVGAGKTMVTWRMDGSLNPLMSLVDRFKSMESMIAPDLEKGLTQLKAAAES